MSTAEPQWVDGEKFHGKDAEAGLSHEACSIDPKLEKRVIRKIDRNLIVLFGILYMMGFLGRVL